MSLRFDTDWRCRRYVTVEQGALLVIAGGGNIDITWPLGRPRALGFELFDRGRSGMVRIHLWQFSWGRGYCYIADRKLDRIHWLKRSAYQ